MFTEKKSEENYFFFFILQFLKGDILRVASKKQVSKKNRNKGAKHNSYQFLFSQKREQQIESAYDTKSYQNDL